MGRNIYPNDNPSTPAKAIYVNDSGTWKPARAMWVNQSGTWTKVWPAQAAWYLPGAELVAQQYPVTPMSWDIWGFCFGNNGSSIYFNDGASTDGVYTYTYRYNLSTPWDITTMSNTGQYYRTAISTQRDVNTSVFFNDTGTRMYVLYQSGYVYQYSLNTAWDPSSVATSTNKKFTEVPHDVFPSADGLSFYGITTGQIIYNHASSSAWSLTSTTATASTSASFPHYSGAIRTNSLQLFGGGVGNAIAKTYNLTSARNIVGFTDANQNSPTIWILGMAFSTDGANLYSSTGASILQYRLV